jgi:hypothetical protein
MRAKILSVDEIRNCDGRNYNPTVWENNINRMLDRYKDVVFYKVDRDKVYQYDRYFVEYTLQEGLRLFGSFGYSSSMTSGGFYRLDKVKITDDGRGYQDLIKLIDDGNNDEAHSLMLELNESNHLDISYGKFLEQSTGEMVMISTTKEARDWMTERSVKYGMTFTKG